MKRLFAFVFLAFGLIATAQTQSRITATITVTNSTIGLDTIVVNGDTRTWTNVVNNSANQILANADIATSTTNLWNHISANQFAGPVIPQFAATNVINLIGAIGSPMVISFNGTWATVSLSTQTVSTLTTVRVPMSSEQNSVRTNVATLIVTNLDTYSQIKWGTASPLLANFDSLAGNQTVTGAKTLSNTNNSYWGQITNSYLNQSVMAYPYTNSGGVYFQNAVGNLISVIAANGDGLPSLFYNGATPHAFSPPTVPASYAPNPENLLNVLIASNSFGGLNWANYFAGTNQFNRITNSAIVGSTFRNSPGISGTVEFMTNGFYVAPKLTNTVSVGFPNFSGSNYMTGTFAYSLNIKTSLANGNNAGVNFGAGVFYKLNPGPTGAFAICGIAVDLVNDISDGRMLILYNNTGQNMTIANNSGVDGTASNRILTNTGGDIVTTGNGVVTLIYDAADQKWVVTSFQP